MNLFIVWFHKVSILPPPHRRSFEIPRGRGVLKAKLLQEKYEAKLEFPGIPGTVLDVVEIVTLIVTLVRRYVLSPPCLSMYESLNSC